MADAASFATEKAPLCSGPDPEPKLPTRFVVPKGAVDTHAHILGLPPRYSLSDARGYTAPEAPLSRYLAMLDATGMTHGVLVQASVHGTDNSLIKEALIAQKGKLKGIAVVPPEVDERGLEDLSNAGYVGCRFNVLFGGGVGFGAIDTLAQKSKTVRMAFAIFDGCSRDRADCEKAGAAAGALGYRPHGAHADERWPEKPGFPDLPFIT